MTRNKSPQPPWTASACRIAGDVFTRNGPVIARYPRASSITPALGLLRNAVADEHGDVVADYRIPEGSVHCLGFRRSPADRCVRSGIHAARFFELYSRGRDD